MAIAEPARAPVAPARAPGLSLLGPVSGSGYRRPPCLVRRGDGQTLQLTPLLYETLAALDGGDLAAVADRVSEAKGVLVTADDVRRLVDEKLRPLGLLAGEDGGAPDAATSNPLLALRFRYVVTDPAVTARITRPFAALFRPAVVAAVTVAFVAVCGWLFFGEGLAPATRQVLQDPTLLLAVFALTIVSAGFHELGHAAACHYGGARPGAMGVGLYLVFPAFYTDVTSSYGLDRRGRLRVDLGGLYFNAVFAVGAFLLWAATRADPLLVLVPLQIVQMVRQLLPLIRLDGYHILADLTGVPHLFAHIKPTLLGLLPSRRGDRRSRALRPWARVVVTAWVLLVVPLLALMLLVMVLSFPRIAATAWAGAEQQWLEVTTHWGEGDMPRLALAGVGMLAFTLPFPSTAYLLGRIVRRSGRRLWQATEDAPQRRTALLLAMTGGAIVLAAAWWPGPQYRPIAADERGTIGDLLHAVHVTEAPTLEPVETAGAGTGEGQPQRQGTIGTDVPTVVVVVDPADVGLDPAILEQFDFQLPDAPDPEAGDNQALARNRVDGSIVRVGEASLVWVFEGEVAMRNEAWALSNCRGCASEALAYQVVLVVGDAEVVAPENVAVAVNGNCVDCVSNAIARQLVLTLGVEPDAAMIAALDEVWQRIETTVADLDTVGLEATMAALESLEQELVTVLAPVLATPAGETTAPTPTTVTATSTSSTTAGDEPASTTGSLPTTGPPSSPAMSTTGEGTGPGATPSTSAPTTASTAPATTVATTAG